MAERDLTALEAAIKGLPGVLGSVAALLTVESGYETAVAAALAAVAGLPVHIRDPQCVAKTFPDYFERLAALTAGAAQPTRDHARS